MLATAPEWRGHKLALILGAHVMPDMAERLGIQQFMTGVTPGNTPSEMVCTNMGLFPSNASILGCVDPAALVGGHTTK